MKLLEFENAINELREKKQLVIFTGAGISIPYPSNCLAWDKLIFKVITHITTKLQNTTFEGVFESIQYDRKIEHICQILYDNMPEDFLTLLDILLFGKPNKNHEAIAELFSSHKLKHIITTNFDNFIEKALIKKGIEVKSHCNKVNSRLLSEDYNNRQQNISDVIKPHGTIEERCTMEATLRHAGSPLDKSMDKFITDIFLNDTVLIVGYSGLDDDIFPLINNVSNNAKDVYWGLYEDENELDIIKNPNLALLAKSCRNENFKFFKMGGRDLLPKLTNCTEISFSEEINSAIKAKQDEHLDKWFEIINEDALYNFFVELFITSDYNFNNSELQAFSSIIKEVIINKSDPLVLAKAHKNYSLILAKMYKKQGDSVYVNRAELLKSFDKTIEVLYQIGRKKEALEAMVAFVEYEDHANELTWNGRKYSSLAISWAGKFFDHYYYSLAHFITGYDFYNNNRYDLAINYSIESAGFAIKSGDQSLLLKNLYFLQHLLEEEPNNSIELSQVNKYINYLEGNLISDDISMIPRNEFINSANRAYKKYIIGELTLVIVFLLISSPIILMATKSPQQAILCFLCALGGSLYGKFGVFLKKRIYFGIESR